MKTCRRCGSEFPATEEFFHKDSKVKSGLRSRCKPCITQGNLETRDTELARKNLQAWRKSNPEKVKEQQDRVSNKRTVSGYYKRYYRENSVRINARRNKWGHENGKFTEYSHRRRDLLRELLPNKDWQEVLDFYGRVCLVPDCGSTEITQDHVIPLSKGGRNRKDNVQPLCLSHNCSKQAKYTDHRFDKGKKFEVVHL